MENTLLIPAHGGHGRFGHAIMPFELSSLSVAAGRDKLGMCLAAPLPDGSRNVGIDLEEIQELAPSYTADAGEYAEILTEMDAQPTHGNAGSIRAYVFGSAARSRRLTYRKTFRSLRLRGGG